MKSAMKYPLSCRSIRCANKPFNAFRLLIVSVIISLIPANEVQAQKDVDYAVHANIIYHFTKYIEWPETDTRTFVVGVVGETPLYDELVKVVKNRKAGNRRIEVKSISASSEIDCEILFISEYSSGNVKKIAAKTAGKPVLLVTEEEGLIA